MLIAPPPNLDPKDPAAVSKDPTDPVNVPMYPKDPVDSVDIVTDLTDPVAVTVDPKDPAAMSRTPSTMQIVFPFHQYIALKAAPMSAPSAALKAAPSVYKEAETIDFPLEPVFCKKQPKKVPTKKLVRGFCGN